MTTYPYLESCSCSLGCRSQQLSIRYSEHFSFRVYGCGGPYGPGRRVDPSTIDARQRKQVGDGVAALMARGQIDRAAGSRFLDRLFSWLPTPESVAEEGALSGAGRAAA